MTRSASSGTRRNATVRCAIYARKSSEEGLDQEFNSLQAQREALRGPSSTANGTKAGCACPNVMTTAASPARRSAGAATAARRHRGEAEIVRSIFRRYVELGSVRLLKEELEARGTKSKSWTSASGRLRGGKPFSRGALHLILQKPHLSRRGRSQGAIPSRRTQADHRSAAEGRGSGAAREQHH